MELTTWNLPVLALRGLTVFPHMTLTFDVERPISIAALERAMEADQDIFLVTQREIGGERAGGKGPVHHWHGLPHHADPAAGPVHRVRVMVEGRQRAHLRRLWQTEPFLQANVEAIPEEPSSEAMRKQPPDGGAAPPDLRPVRRVCRAGRRRAGGGGGHGDGQPGPGLSWRTILPRTSPCATPTSRRFWRSSPPSPGCGSSTASWCRENNVLGFEHEMEGKVRDQLARTQRDQILRTQIRVLQNELGEDDDGRRGLRSNPTARRSWPWSCRRRRRQHLLKEVNKLAKQPFGSSAEACGDPQLSGRVPGDALEHHHQGAGQCGRRPQGAGTATTSAWKR